MDGKALYDLNDDRAETTNLFESNTDTVRELQNELDQLTAASIE
jgi:hypothetical protein